MYELQMSAMVTGVSWCHSLVLKVILYANVSIQDFLNLF